MSFGRRIYVLGFIFLLVLLVPTSVFAQESTYELWVTVEKSDFGTKQYYYYDLHVGNIHWEYMVDFLEEDNNPDYDFYAIYLFITLTPSIRIGDGHGYIFGGYVIFDLKTSDNMIAHRLPGSTSGTAEYGVSVTIGVDGGASFSASTSYSIPYVEISPLTDYSWGGYVRWDFEMNSVWWNWRDGARDDENDLYFTALVRAQEGAPVYFDIIIHTKWYYDFYRWGTFLEYTETISVYYDGTPNQPSSGCPHLLIYDGNNFIYENNLIPESVAFDPDAPFIEDYVDYYKITNNILRVYNDSYILRIAELDNDISFIDDVRLLAVIHLKHINIGINQYDEIIAYKRHLLPPSYAVDSYGENVLPILAYDDGIYYSGNPGDYIILKFDHKRKINSAKLIIKADYITKYSIFVQALTIDNNWQTIAIVHPRLNWYTSIIDLTYHLKIIKKPIVIRLVFTGNHKIDYIGLELNNNGNRPMIIYELPLIRAISTNNEDIKELLVNSDNEYLVLQPGDFVTLYFATINIDWSYLYVDFVLVIEGHYIRVV